MELESEIWDYVDCLRKELEISKNHNQDLEKQLELWITATKESIPEAYVKIREQNRSLFSENNKLVLKLNELEKNLNEMKKKYDERERDFYEELQMAQVTSAMEFDQIEQKLKWHISEANKEIEQKKVIITKLEIQLRNMEQKQSYSTNALFLPPITETCSKENVGEQFYSEEYPDCDSLQVPEKDKNNSEKRFEAVASNNSFLRTYEPLQVKCKIPSENKIEKMGNTCKQHITPLFKGKKHMPKRFRDNKSTNSLTIPPLMPCSTSKYPVNKKRRLHDPEDLSYLVNLMGDNDE